MNSKQAEEVRYRVGSESVRAAEFLRNAEFVEHDDGKWSVQARSEAAVANLRRPECIAAIHIALAASGFSVSDVRVILQQVVRHA
jgi:hypothetical protein